MAGFGRPGAKSASNMTGASSSAAAGNTTLIADILGFEGDGSKTLESCVLTAFFLTLCVSLLKLSKYSLTFDMS